MVEIDAKALVARLRALGGKVRVALGRELDRTAAEVRERLVARYWKTRTGRTSRATQVDAPGPLWRRIAVKVPWGVYLDQGTRPHLILPRRAKALRFNGGFFARARHPGTRGMRFVGKETARAGPLLARRVSSAIQRFK